MRRHLLFQILIITVVAIGSGVIPIAAQQLDDPMRQLDLERMAGMPQPSDARSEMLSYQGSKLTPEQASKLEETVASSPNDLQTRTQLLGYYFSGENRKGTTAEVIEMRRRHILWIIEHRPQSDAAALVSALIAPTHDPLADPTGYQRAHELWVQAVELHREDPKVLYNAAWFFHVYDKQRSEQIVLEGMQLEPENPEWKFLLGTVYVFGILGVNQIESPGEASGFDLEEQKGSFAKYALDKVQNSRDPNFLALTGSMLSHAVMMARVGSGGNQDSKLDVIGMGESLLKRAAEMEPEKYGFALGRSYETKAMMTRDPQARKELMQKAFSFEEPMLKKAGPLNGMYVSMVCETAIAAEEFDKAETCARQLLSIGGSDSTFGPVGSELHAAHTFLGRIAFRNGQIEDAKRELIESGKVPSDPALMSFGPSMLLAKELLEKGEKQTVLTYLDLCAKFWEMGQDQLADWKETIQAGGTPDFGVHAMR
jgi:hypothetical protein